MKRALALVCALALATPCGAQEGEARQPIRLIDAFAPFYDPARTPPRSWAMPFGHLDTATPPYVALEHLEASLDRFDDYCRHVRRRAYNAVIVGNLIHMVTFDRVAEGPVYAADSPFRARAEAYQAAFKRACAIAAKHQLRVAVDTDFPAWTPELRAWLGPAGLAIDNERLWQAYAAAVTELFEDVGVWALHVRIGEGGGAYNEATGYRSAISVRTEADLQQVVDRLLGLVEGYNAAHPGADRKLLFRTWSIGIGEIGALHTDPELYQRVFEPFGGRGALATLIKYVAMDFFAHVPLNPTIGVGEVQQVVEFQARREYEGFGLYPNFRAEPFREALARFRQDATFAGISVWPTNGGFLLESPTYYRSQGCDRWIDANVFAYGWLLEDPSQEPQYLAQAWGLEQGLRQADAERLARILLASDDVIARGLYLVPYAENAPALFGVDVFPTMLWHYWTRPVAAYGVQALVSRESSAELERSLADGRWAVEELGRLQGEAQALPTGELRDDLLAALAFQRSHFEVLAAYREVFLPHFRWVRHGDGAAYEAWQAGLPALEAAVAAHEAEYGERRFLPAFDLRELHRLLRDDRLIPSLRPLAGLLAVLDLLAALACLALLAATPRGPAWVRRRPALAASLVGALGAATLMVWTAVYAPVGAALAGLALALAPVGALALVLALPARRLDEQAGVSWAARCLAAAGPALLALAALSLSFAWRGPGWAWSQAVDALLGSWGARALVLGGVAATAGLTLACWGRAARLVLGSGRGAAVATLAALAVSSGLGAGAWSLGGVPALLAVNDTLRAAPSILGQAGTGVEDLIGEESH
jgi:hypothetical protein